MLQFIYLTFAVLGAVLTALANYDFVQAYGPGFDVIKFIELANINPAAQSLSRDLLVTCGAFFTWIIVEARRLEMRNLWIVIITTFLIAFAFAAPLFLFLREKRILEMKLIKDAA